jgi:hypothetical protein
VKRLVKRLATFNEDRIRTEVALVLIDAGRRLLKLPETKGDRDRCGLCNVGGCSDGTAEHLPDCPSVTGVYTVTLADMWPAGMRCGRCEIPLRPGDKYSLITLEKGSPAAGLHDAPIFKLAWTGCAVLAELGAEEKS